MKRTPLTLTVGILLAIIFAVLLFTFQVRTTQVAVVTTFGKPTRSISEPGAYFKLPWPIQRVYYFDRLTQNLEDKFTQDFTADGRTLLTSVYVGWKISDPQEFFLRFAGGSVQAAENVLSGIVRSVKTATIGRHPFSDFISVSGGGTNFTAIEDEMLAGVRAQVEANQYGIEIEFLGIKKLGLPESVTEEVFKQMTSERQRLVQQLTSEGETLAAGIKSDANRRAAEIIAVAQGQANEIRGRGEAEAATALAKFQQNPELALFIFRLRAFEEALKGRSTLIFDRWPPFLDAFMGVTTNAPAR